MCVYVRFLATLMFTAHAITQDGSVGSTQRHSASQSVRYSRRRVKTTAVEDRGTPGIETKVMTRAVSPASAAVRVEQCFAV